MKIRSLSLLAVLTAFLARPLYAQATCHIFLPNSSYNEILKEILRRSVVDAKEFDAVSFRANSVDLTVSQDKTSGAFFVSPREKFTGEFPATWANVDKLNTQLTVNVLDHLEKFRTERKRSAQDAADIFIGSLNWKRLAEQKPAEVVAEPHLPAKTTASQPRVQLWKLLGEQLFLIFGPLAIGLLFGLPFGKVFYKNQWTNNFFSSLTGIFLTVPPIALLCFFIPSYGMGRSGTLVALILFNILLVMKYSVDEPKAWSSPFIGKLKKLVILNVNLSTLAAFLGVGGFGSLISLGLALNDIPLTLRGTLSVAFLAMALKWIFEGLEYVLAKREGRI